MACEDKTQIFNETLARIQSDFKKEMEEFAIETEKKTSALDDELKNENDLAEGIGASAGAAIGGAVGGTPGAIAGAALGKTIGSLFEIEITEQDVNFDLPIPEFGVQDQEWIFTLPKITMKDEDIIFDLPSMTMKRIEGPPKAEVTIRQGTGPFGIPFPETVITWTPTYLDVPEYTTVRHTIVVGIPQVTMVDEKIVVGVPTVTVTNQTLSIKVPSITVRSVQDLSKSVAEAGKKIADEAMLVSEAKKQALKARMRAELLPPAQDMFLCHRNELLFQRSQLDSRLSGQVEIATNTLIALKAKAVPEDDDDFVAARKTADALVDQRRVQLEKFDEALATLDRSSQEALEKMMAG